MSILTVTRPVTGLLARGAVALLLVLGATACGSDSTGPGGSSAGLTVRVTTVGAPTYSYSPDSVAIIACDVSLRAKAEGFAIEWQSAMFRWYLDAARTLPFDSVVVDAGSIQQSWGSASLAGGASATSDWNFRATVPFTTTVEYRFTDSQGNSGSTKPVAFSCRPPIAANPAPPSVTNVQVLPAGEVEPGDTVTVRYTFSSGAGLWQLVVGTTGACDTLVLVPGRLASGGTHDVRLVLPHGCTSGLQMQVVVQAVDAAVRVAEGQSGPVPVQDRTAPSLDLWMYHPEDGSTTRQLDGTYFGQDTIRLVVDAIDNGVVQSLQWSLEPGGIHDSVSLVGRTGPSVPVVIPNGLNGSYQLTVQVRDLAGLTSPVISSAPGAFALRPTLARPTVAQTTIPGDARDGIIDEPRGRIYLLHGNQQRLTVLSLATLAIEQTLQLSSLATGLDLSEGGDSLLLAVPGSRAYGVIDLRQPNLQLALTALTVGSPGCLEQQATVTVGGQLFLSCTAFNAATIQVDLATKAQRLRTDLTTRAVVRSLDRRVVAVGQPGGVMVYDPVLDAVSPSVPVQPGSFISVDRTGARIAVQLNVFDRNLQLIRVIPHNFGIAVPVSILSADGSYLHYRYGNYVIRAGVADGNSVDRVPFPYESEFFRLSPSGNFLVSVAGYGRPQSTVVVIDLR